MRGTLRVDDVDALVFEAAGGNEEQHLALGRRFEDLAPTAPRIDELSDTEQVSAKELLVQAGEQYGFAGDHQRALTLFRRAVETGDDVGLDARCFVVGALLQLGETADADEVARQIRRSKPTDPFVFKYLGETYETHDRPEEAIRWFTRGVLLVVDGDSRDNVLMTYLLLSGRLRVRQAMGFPEDDYDLLASAYLDRLGGWDDEAEDGWDEDDVSDDVVPPPSRNGPCVCGSGKKYKHCCARDIQITGVTGTPGGLMAVNSRQGDLNVIDIF